MQVDWYDRRAAQVTGGVQSHPWHPLTTAFSYATIIHIGIWVLLHYHWAVAIPRPLPALMLLIDWMMGRASGLKTCTTISIICFLDTRSFL